MQCDHVFGQFHGLHHPKIRILLGELITELGIYRSSQGTPDPPAKLIELFWYLFQESRRIHSSKITMATTDGEILSRRRSVSERRNRGCAGGRTMNFFLKI